MSVSLWIWLTSVHLLQTLSKSVHIPRNELQVLRGGDAFFHYCLIHRHSTASIYPLLSIDFSGCAVGPSTLSRCMIKIREKNPRLSANANHIIEAPVFQVANERHVSEKLPPTQYRTITQADGSKASRFHHLRSEPSCLSYSSPRPYSPSWRDSSRDRFGFGRTAPWRVPPSHPHSAPPTGTSASFATAPE